MVRCGQPRWALLSHERPLLFFLWNELDVYCKELIVKPPDEAPYKLLGQIEKVLRRFWIDLSDKDSISARYLDVPFCDLIVPESRLSLVYPVPSCGLMGYFVAKKFVGVGTVSGYDLN